MAGEDLIWRSGWDNRAFERGLRQDQRMMGRASAHFAEQWSTASRRAANQMFGFSRAGIAVFAGVASGIKIAKDAFLAYGDVNAQAAADAKDFKDGWSDALISVGRLVADGAGAFSGFGRELAGLADDIYAFWNGKEALTASEREIESIREQRRADAAGETIAAFRDRADAASGTPEAARTMEMRAADRDLGKHEASLLDMLKSGTLTMREYGLAIEAALDENRERKKNAQERFFRDLEADAFRAAENEAATALAEREAADKAAAFEREIEAQLRLSQVRSLQVSGRQREAEMILTAIDYEEKMTDVLEHETLALHDKLYYMDMIAQARDRELLAVNTDREPTRTPSGRVEAGSASGTLLAQNFGGAGGGSRSLEASQLATLKEISATLKRIIGLQPAASFGP